MSLYLATRHSPYCRKPWRESPSSCFCTYVNVFTSLVNNIQCIICQIRKGRPVLPVGRAAPVGASGTLYWSAAGAALRSPPLNSGIVYCRPSTSYKTYSVNLNMYVSVDVCMCFECVVAYLRQVLQER